MKKQIIRLTESDLHKIIENTVNKIIASSNTEQISEVIDRNDYENNDVYEFDRGSDIQDVKIALGDFIKEQINEYHLTKEEVNRILQTMIRYFNNYNFE